MSRPRPTVLAPVAVSLAAAILALILFGPSGCGGKHSTAPPAPGSASVNGVVKDAISGTALQGVAVKASSGAATTTDANGRFTISIGVNVGVRLDVTRSDYSLNQVVLHLTPGASQAMTVNLIPAGTTSSVAVASGGKVTDAGSNATLTLPAGFVTTSGSVNVRVTGLDPTSNEVKALPGGLDAVDANGKAVYLKPVSFAEYTVTDGSGNVLPYNSSASQGADIELPIPASLRGQPGYKNGDPIECYVYDPADGKWKTPVPGVIGPSSVDGQPAIKATIFHLSWYGGAPAASETGCVQGTVTVDGSPAANIDVEAFPGGRTRTDAQGHFEVQAALNSSVRVNASVVTGTMFRSAEGTVSVGGNASVCAHVDLALGAATIGLFEIYAGLLHIGTHPPADYDFATASITVGSAQSQDPFLGAVVQLGTGNTWVTLPETGGGNYSLLGTAPDFVLTSGAQYTMRFDFDHNGTYDASGQVRMVGIPVMTSPPQNASVGHSFTAAWTDQGTSTQGYAATYIGTLTQNTGGSFASFGTSSLSKVLGTGVTDPVSHLANPPLTAGRYQLEVAAGAGPLWDILLNPLAYVPNITGNNASGYLMSFASGDTVGFTSTGLEPAAAARPASGAPPSAAALRTRQSIARVQELFAKWSAAAKRAKRR